MSGGSYNYIYSQLESECEGQMHDSEMNMLIKDLCKVLHDLEWWQSGDYSEESYRESVAKFKAKWFKGDRKQIAKEYIDSQVGIIQTELYNLFEIPKGEIK